MQKGSIVQVGNCWMLRYYEPVIENGRVVKKQKTVKLDFTPKSNKQKDVEEAARAAADLILAPINAQTAKPETRIVLGTFLQHLFLPYVKEKKRPSTYISYRQCWQLLGPHMNGKELREFHTSDIDDLLNAATGDKKRAHTTHRNLKNFLSSAFRLAIRKNFFDGDNPVRYAEIPRGLPSRPKQAYSLDEIQNMIAVLPEPARTIVIVAAFTGLRKQEIKGLRWEDFRGDELHIQRSVFGRHIDEPKTLASKAPVPVLPIVRKALEEHRQRTPDVGYIFAGITSQKPLRIENLLRREMRPVLDKHKITWKGWHAFRRGLGTNLNALGVEPKTIQAILRHSELSTTMEIYVQPIAKESHAAMKKLERAFKSAKSQAGR